MSLNKHTTGEISRELHVDRTSVYSWVKNWNTFREEGLLEEHRSGRPSRLTDANKEILYDIVESEPIAHGFHSGIWTSEMIIHVIEDDFQITYHPGHVRKLLKHLGFSVQRPGTQLVQTDIEKQNKWIRYTYPDLLKKPKKKMH